MGFAFRATAVALLGGALLFCGARGRAPAPSAPARVAPPPPVAASSAPPAPRAAEPREDDALRFRAIDDAVRAALDAGKMPGCVVVVGRSDGVVFRRAYGARALVPERAEMTADTVFDLASLTKPIATATSVMILVERGAVRLDAPAVKYVPELGALPPFTVEQLLLHTSGLPAGTPVADYAGDRSALMRRIAGLTPKSRPGERFVYSDVGFVVLEEIIRRASGKDLAAFAAEEIFSPLGMRETGFLPPPALRARAAPTEERDGGWMVGEVHDPRAFAMGGVAGHAGLFGTADDLARFARAMLGRGALEGSRVLAEATFASMVTRRDTPGGGRALGWDVDSTYATHRSPLLSARAFGHGGFTGTALWIDPERDLFVLFLSNRVHPDGKGTVNPLIAELATASARALEVDTGIDVLRGEGFARLRGARVGLLTNESARAKDGATTLDVLRGAEGVALAAIFTPEHGLAASREGKIGDGAYAGLPVYSLYGDRYAPDDTTLAGLDALVVDLQDAGVRFYTYASTMKRAMRMAAERGLRFVVLDRPNPLGGLAVQGPVLARADRSFVNHHHLPIRHGMTMGELARLFAADDALDVRLEVVAMRGWRRGDYFDRTGLAWVSPSPNLRSVEEVVLYPALGLLEATNVSVGRGTDTPFELVGAPWLDGEALARRLAGGALPGVTFQATEFTPRASVHAGKRCKGVRARVTDRARFDPVRMGVALAVALRDLHRGTWEMDKLDRLLQSGPAMDALRAGKDVDEIEATWRDELAAFAEKRPRFLLYR